MEKKIRLEVVLCVVLAIAIIALGATMILIFGRDGNTDNALAEPTATPAAQSAAPSVSAMYIVNVTDHATMYAAPNVGGGTVSTLPLGTLVNVYTDALQDGFYKIEYSGLTGYIEAQYVSPDYAMVEKQVTVNRELAAAQAEAQRKASLSQGSSATTVQYSKWVYNVKNSIYLRTHPSDNADIITTIPVNTRVGYIDTWGGWNKISYNGQVGYSKSMYLTSSNPYSGGTWMVVTNVPVSAYLRVTASSSTDPSNIVCEVPAGSYVEYFNTMGDYKWVRYNGKTGYIMSKYLRYAN